MKNATVCAVWLIIFSAAVAFLAVTRATPLLAFTIFITNMIGVFPVMWAAKKADAFDDMQRGRI